MSGASSSTFAGRLGFWPDGPGHAPTELAGALHPPPAGAGPRLQEFVGAGPFRGRSIAQPDAAGIAGSGPHARASRRPGRSCWPWPACSSASRPAGMRRNARPLTSSKNPVSHAVEALVPSAARHVESRSAHRVASGAGKPLRTPRSAWPSGHVRSSTPGWPRGRARRVGDCFPAATTALDLAVDDHPWTVDAAIALFCGGCRPGGARGGRRSQAAGQALSQQRLTDGVADGPCLPVASDLQHQSSKERAGSRRSADQSTRSRCLRRSTQWATVPPRRTGGRPHAGLAAKRSGGDGATPLGFMGRHGAEITSQAVRRCAFSVRNVLARTSGRLALGNTMGREDATPSSGRHGD